MIFWINALIASLIVIADSLEEIVALAGRLSFRSARWPLLIAILAGGTLLQAVWPRDINHRASVAGIGVFFLFVCGMVEAFTVSSVNDALGYDLYQMRWSAVYFGGALILFSMFGFEKESRLQYAERMMTQGRFSNATSAVEALLQDEPDNLGAVQLQKELREMIRLAP